ncbi:MAG: malic enzyme-like NAD(P)-binding protein, partial [Pedococcus sp.]
MSATAVSSAYPLFDPTDPVFRAHEGGKLGVHATQPLRDRADLALLYTPGVADVSRAIALDPTVAARYTARSNTVAVVTDGTAVLGLGDLGPLAALPVMEGKAVLFKHFGGIDAVPVCMETGSVDELVEAIARIAPTYGGINLEDISAPRCFEIEQRLQERLDIPVFHDDQHGTAIVTLAALTNALRVVAKDLPSCRVVIAGAGAAGSAIVTLLMAAGATDIVVYDRHGCRVDGDPELSPAKQERAAITNPRRVAGDLRAALQGADVFIGVSAPNILVPEWITEMADRAVVFALANPDPEVDPAEAGKYAAVVASGRSDYP